MELPEVSLYDQDKRNRKWTYCRLCRKTYVDQIFDYLCDDCVQQIVEEWEAFQDWLDGHRKEKELMAVLESCPNTIPEMISSGDLDEILPDIDLAVQGRYREMNPRMERVQLV
jgi:hypothetical protein